MAKKNADKVVNDSIGLVERFATFMGSVGKVAGAVADASTQAAEMAKQAHEVKKSVEKCYNNGKKQSVKSS